MDKINIAELLKGCPSGMELDCAMYEDVYFDYIDELNIIHCYIQHETHKTSITFNQHGTYNSDIKSKCVIFPKGKTTWEGFQRPFKDGDILYIYSAIPWICIYKEGGEKDNVYYKYVAITSSSFVYDCSPLCHRNHVKEIRHATEEEKQKLLKAIKDRGYKWNTETKTLEMLIEPKFKAGDRIILKDNPHNIPSVKIKEVTKSQYILEKEGFFYINSTDEKYVLEDKFDINTLVPFESRVLVRDTKSQKWSPAIWGFYDSDSQDYQYKLVGIIARYCIPYEGNQHLLGTTDDCDKYFKTWE